MQVKFLSICSFTAFAAHCCDGESIRIEELVQFHRSGVLSVLEFFARGNYNPVKFWSDNLCRRILFTFHFALLHENP